MPKRRKRKCTEPRCCWHQGCEGTDFRGVGGLGAIARPVKQTLP